MSQSKHEDMMMLRKVELRSEAQKETSSHTLQEVVYYGELYA
jgi:hypothetical protein